MANIVVVHGMNNEYRGAELVLQDVLPALKVGMGLAGYDPVPDAHVAAAFYGHVFRPAGGMVASPRLDPRDLTQAEGDLLLQYWQHAVSAGEDIPKPEDDTKSLLPEMAQRALLALARTTLLKSLNDSDIIRHFVRQPIDYLTQPDIKQQVQDAVFPALSADTRVIVAHSLGSIVAYEMLTRQQAPWSAEVLITLGSPLGIPNVVFERLTPAPVNRKGAFPNVKRWVNIAAKDDFVAMHKQLDTLFGTPERCVVDMYVHNGTPRNAHALASYLTAAETGKVIAEALRSY